MAITTSATITFRLIVNNEAVYAKMHIPNATSLEALETFASALKDYTKADIIAISFSTEKELNIVGEGGGTSGEKANLLFHGTPGGTKSKNFCVPAPVQGMFSEISGKGLLVTIDAGAELAEAYGTLVGETFKFVRGRYA